MQKWRQFSPAHRGPLALSVGGCGKSFPPLTRHEPPCVFCPSRWRYPGFVWCNLKQLYWLCEMTWPTLVRLSAVIIIMCDALLLATHYYCNNFGLNHYVLPGYINGVRTLLYKIHPKNKMSSFAHSHVISVLYEFRLLQKKIFFLKNVDQLLSLTVILMKKTKKTLRHFSKIFIYVSQKKANKVTFNNGVR